MVCADKLPQTTIDAETQTLCHSCVFQMHMYICQHTKFTRQGLDGGWGLFVMILQPVRIRPSKQIPSKSILLSPQYIPHPYEGLNGLLSMLIILIATKPIVLDSLWLHTPHLLLVLLHQGAIGCAVKGATGNRKSIKPLWHHHGRRMSRWCPDLLCLGLLQIS